MAGYRAKLLALILSLSIVALIHRHVYGGGTGDNNDAAGTLTTSGTTSTLPTTTKTSRDNERYLADIRGRIVEPPWDKPSKAVLRKKTINARVADRILSGRRNGFYVECGAYDGEEESHTLFFETLRNWTGLLVEANQRLFRQILTRNRRAYVFGGCLSSVPRPVMLPFQSAGAQGGLEGELTAFMSGAIKSIKSFESRDLVQCYPLSDLLAAINVNHVDFLSLDVQGAEYAILQTIDFRRLRVDVIVAEIYDNDATVKRQLFDRMRRFFVETGLYRVAVELPMDLVVHRIDIDAPILAADLHV